MLLSEAFYIETINSFTEQKWSPLLNLIPAIERSLNFGKPFESIKIAEGLHTFPSWTHSAIVSDFLDIVYEMPIIINFDWVSWDEGSKIANDKDFNLDNIDIPTKCKIITAIVRNDRFCEGALVIAFESGLILKILKSIENQLLNGS